MNLPFNPQLLNSDIQSQEKINTVTIPQLNEAKRIASEHKRPLIEVLENLLTLEPDHFVMAIGQFMHYPVLNMQTAS